MISADTVFKVDVIESQAIFHVPAVILTAKSAKNQLQFCASGIFVNLRHNAVGVFGINSFGNFAELRDIVAKINQSARFALNLF